MSDRFNLLQIFFLKKKKKNERKQKIDSCPVQRLILTQL